MKVPALHIEINGEPVAVAGAEGLSLLSAHVGIGVGSSGALDIQTVMFSVLGIDVTSAQPRQLSWGNGIQLKLGDRVTLEVVETADPTPPNRILHTPSSEQLSAAAAAPKRSAKKVRR